jgi:hypothetical protein
MHVTNINNCANCAPNPLMSTYVIHRLKNEFVHILCKIRDVAVGIAIGYRLDNGRVADRVPVEPRMSLLHCPDRLWGPHSLLSNEYRGKAVGLSS